MLPSHAYETLGKTILESYAYGRAVIASDLGSRREFVQHGKLAFSIGLAKRTNWQRRSGFWQNGRNWRRMGRAGREFVRERHSPDDHYLALASIYETLAATRKRPRRIPFVRNTLVAAAKNRGYALRLSAVAVS